jgi:hypothetical protein
MLQDQWPADQNVWLQTISICVDSNDQLNLRKTIKRMKDENIQWTSEGLKQWAFYTEELHIAKAVAP